MSLAHAGAHVGESFKIVEQVVTPFSHAHVGENFKIVE